MAEAIQRLFPHVRLVYGPPLDTGFYYDISFEGGKAIRINGTLESSQGITLISDHGDVSVNGKLQGRNGNPLPSLTIIANERCDPHLGGV